MQEEIITYEIIRSKRKTLALQVKRDGSVVVRAPFRISEVRIRDFVNRNKVWILERQEKFAQIQMQQRQFSQEEREAGRAAAKQYLPQRVAWYAARMGVTYEKITIREQKTRWGSCSSTGSLNFNWKLMLLPRELLDYVVVHELAHRKVMNHSPAFWAVVEAELPDYRELRAQLKEYAVLM